MCLPSSVSPLFLCCNRPFVFQSPVVVGVSAVQFRVVQKVTRVQPSYVQDSSYRDTARLQMRACVTLSEIRNYPDPSLPSSRRSLVHFGSAETLGWQLQAACIKKSLIHTDLIFFWILHCPKLRWCHRMPSEKSNLRDFCWNGIEDTDVFWPMNSCDFSNLSWSRIKK